MAKNSYTYSSEKFFAAERGLLLLQSLPFYAPDTQIVLVQDNMAAAWALERGYTCNVRAMKSISNILHLHRQLRLCSVVSADNAADQPSRNKLVKGEVVCRMMLSVRGLAEGRRRGIVSGYNGGDCGMAEEKRTRHMEHVEDESLLEDCDEPDTVLDVTVMGCFEVTAVEDGQPAARD